VSKKLGSKKTKRISPICWNAPSGTIVLIFGMRGDIVDIIMQPRQIFYQSLKRFRSSHTHKFAILLHMLSWSPSQQCKHYRATLWRKTVK